MLAKKEVMLSGIQPTANLTLGNYLGAIRNWVAMNKDFDSYFFVVDLHAITVRQDPRLLRDSTRFAVATYIAAGLDPENCSLFIQSHVPEHAQLAWVLNCYGYMGELSRMTQYKDKSARVGSNIPVGVFTYPLLMAADILLYDGKSVPVGADQKQHVELTRDLAQRFNALYGADALVVPEPIIGQVGARVMDLQDPRAKMSKSAENPKGTVFLNDTSKQIEKKFKGAMTDSGDRIEFDVESKPGVSNLLSIQSAFTGKSLKDLEATYEGKLYGHLKVDTADIVVEQLAPMQERTQEILSDPAELDRVLQKGAEKARCKASSTLKRVYERIGFL